MNPHLPSVLVTLLLATLHAPALPGSSGAAPAEQTLTLALQQRASLADAKLSIHFVGYRDDRCPSDVQCAWAGEARAFFWVSGDGLQPQVLTLPWDGSAQPDKHTQRIGSHRFYLRSLEPRPLQAGKIAPGEYRAVLQIHH
jgi:hypothetical protein